MVRHRGGDLSRGIRKKKSATHKGPKVTTLVQTKTTSKYHALSHTSDDDIPEHHCRVKHNPAMLHPGDIHHESKAPENNIDKSPVAYQKLMRRIETSQPNPPTKTTKRKRKRLPSSPAVGDQPTEPANKQEAEDDDELRTALGVQNAAATARENKHFALAISEEDSPLEHVTLTMALQGARLVTNLPPKLRDQFRHQVEDCSDPKALGLPPNMYLRWRQLQSTKSHARIADIEKIALSALRDYRDLFLAFRLTVSQETRMRQLLAAHCLAHALRARRRVSRNDSAMRADNEMESPKDQGFARPRVLILAPMRNCAYDIVSTMLKLAVSESGASQEFKIANKERFEKEFAPDDPEVSDMEDDAETAIVGSIVKKPRKKPLDHRHTFRGNIDDEFKFGICFTKKTVKLYSDFYASDVIIASPLGLLRRNADKARNPGGGRHREEEDDSDTEWKVGITAEQKKRAPEPEDDGFLSSIEICVIDGGHVFSMQNWDSVVRVMAMVNKMPTNVRDTDFSRVREWCLNGEMQRYRQTILFSHYRKSEFLSLMRSFSNHGGRVDIIQTPSQHGTMSEVAVNIRQIFLKVPDVSSPLSATEKRFDFFFDSTLKTLRNSSDTRCLVFIPSYFDFVRVRNRFVRMSEEDSSFRFASMCEYSKGADVSRARGRLYEGSVPFVLITERFHFFWRHWLRGAKTIVWYGLPENGLFYPEILNMTAEAADMGSSVRSVALFDGVDLFRLQTVVGQERCQRMTASNSSSKFLFC